MNKIYCRGIVAQCWYNFTEKLVHGLIYKSTPSDLTYLKKIKYGSEGLQYVNIYKHNDNKKHPLLIYIHGGSWVSGITEMRNSYIAQWAQKGFNTAAISYSYAPQKRFPFQLQEVFTAIDYLYDNADIYGFDTDNILLAGESAGGYFISYIASVIKDDTVLNNLGIKFRHRNDIKIKALVSLSGCFDLQRLSDKSKPQSAFPDLKTMITSYLGMDYTSAVSFLNSDSGRYVSPVVNEGYPPAFLVWADKDLLRFETFDFSEQLRDLNVEFRMFKMDGISGMHAWSIVLLFENSRLCFDAAFDFVKQYMPDYF